MKGGQLTVGRGGGEKKCDIALPQAQHDTAVSRVHCAITPIGRTHVLIENISRNGTRILEGGARRARGVCEVEKVVEGPTIIGLDTVIVMGRGVCVTPRELLDLYKARRPISRYVRDRGDIKGR